MTEKIERHFVTFLSPGTFVHEETTKPIEKWDVKKAKSMAKKIVERHNATPFAFYFTTRARNETDLDSRVIAESKRYYLGGKVETLAEVKARATKEDEILVANMEGNHWDRIITNTNSWRVCQPLADGDVVLEWP
jgi:hypothetical protein